MIDKDRDAAIHIHRRLSVACLSEETVQKQRKRC